MTREAMSAPPRGRRLADALETLWTRRASPGTPAAGFFGEWTSSEFLAPARGAALGSLLGVACWAVLAAVAWTFSG